MRDAPSLILTLAALLCGCTTVGLKNSQDIALYQSDDQRLIVNNTTSESLTIVGKPATPTVVVAPGKSVIIPFRIATVGTLKSPSGTPYWTVAPTGYREVFEELESPSIVDTSSSVLTLRFRKGSGAPSTASFALNFCSAGGGWAKPHVVKADHQIQLPDPIPAVPQAVCP